MTRTWSPAPAVRAPARANSIRNELQRTADELGKADDPNGVPVNIVIGFYSPSDPDKA
jgi:hypothetical protein